MSTTVSDPSRRNNILSINSPGDILPEYRKTPVGSLLEYHKLGAPFDVYSKAQILIGMCMDNRKRLRIPENFAYVLRTGGANLRHSEFNVSYAVAVGRVNAIAVIAHTQCGMVDVMNRRDQFIRGLVDYAGWSRQSAEEHFEKDMPVVEIGNEVEFTLSEAIRLRQRYPNILVAPLLYKVEDHKLYLIH